MLTKRVIACLDIKDGRTVKGTNFIQLRDAGDPVELAEAYAQQGVDELVFLDISATNEKRKTFAGLVKKIAARIDIQWIVHTHGGTVASDKKLFSWAKEGQERGAGEILFTSMDHDGTKNGFAIDPLKKLNELLHIPVIASGGAGSPFHFAEAFTI